MSIWGFNMAISTTGFPGCCTARVLYNFGGGHVGQRENHTKAEVIKQVKNILSNLKRDFVASVVAMPTTTQPNAVAALEELGFYHHPDGIEGGGYFKSGTPHKMCCMFMPLNEWDEKEFNERYDPEEDEYEDKPSYEAVGNARRNALW